MDFCFNEVIILFLILVSQLNRNFHKLKNYQFSQIDKNNIVVTQYSAHEGKIDSCWPHVTPHQNN